MSGDGNTHWCYQCLQPVRLRGHNPVCSYCLGGFVQELDEVVGNGQQDSGVINAHSASDYGFMGPFPDPNRFMDVFAELMRQRMDGSFGIRRSALVPESSGLPWSIFDGEAPADMSVNYGFDFFFNGVPVGARHSNTRNIFMGPGLQEMIEQLIANDRRQGPPPATRPVIDSLPTIRITRSAIDSHCPVCQDKFELGSEARMMPCRHIYHSGCIVPWLLQHNSCPVCRLELPPEGTSRGSRSGGNGGAEEDRGQSQGSRSSRHPLSFLWSFLS